MSSSSGVGGRVAAAADRLLARLGGDATPPASELYEVQQQGSTLVARLVARGQDAEAVALCEKFARGLASQPAMAVSFAVQLVGVLQEFELPATPARVAQLVALAEELPYCPTGTKDFLALAHVWARKVEASRHLQLQLKAAAARVFAKNGEFGSAQAAALELNDSDAIAAVLRQWREADALYASEKHLLSLRAVLLLLAAGKVDLALQVIQSPVLEYNLDSINTPPPVQLAYLLAVACKEKNAPFFEFCAHSKYGLVMYRDQGLSKLVQQVQTRFFAPATGNLFQNLLAAAGTARG